MWLTCACCTIHVQCVQVLVLYLACMATMLATSLAMCADSVLADLSAYTVGIGQSARG
jgi:hypothetical protein